MFHVKRRLRRTIARVLGLLVAGAIINVAVAWGCALCSDTGLGFTGTVVIDGGRSDVSDWLAEIDWDAAKYDTWFVEGSEDESSLRGVDEKEWEREIVVNDRYLNPHGSLLVVRRAGLGRVVFEAWWQPAIADSLWPAIGSIQRAGWPWLALEGEIVPLAGEHEWATLVMEQRQLWRAEALMGVDHASLAPNWFGGMPEGMVPLRPVWPGFAINTISYAAILWLLVATPRCVRRWRRVRRGLCAGCGYPVGESEICTECGKPVEPRGVVGA